MASFHLDGVTDEHIGDAFGITTERVADMREDELWERIVSEILRALVQEEVEARKPVITTEEKDYEYYTRNTYSTAPNT